MKRKPVSATYISSFTQCLQKFFFKYHTDKKPVMTGEARAFGIAVHEALEFMYERLSKSGNLPTEEDYNAVYKHFLDSGVQNSLVSQDLYDEGRAMLKARLDSYDPAEKILGLELRFGFDFEDSVDVSTPGGTPLIGAIDKIFELDEDTIVVSDYKTSRTALTDAEAAIDPQMSLYDLVIHQLFPQYKNVIIVIDYLRLKPVITHRTEEQRLWFGKFVDALYEQVDNLTEDDIRPRLNEFCGWCDFKHYCTAYHKTITDPDLLVKPLEQYADDEFVDEWARFNNIRRILEGRKRELSMHGSTMLENSGGSEIVGTDTTLYKIQTSRVYYDVSTVLNTIPKVDCIGMMSVNKTSLDRYLLDHPEYADAINDTAKVSFASSFFKQKKTKK